MKHYAQVMMNIDEKVQKNSFFRFFLSYVPVLFFYGIFLFLYELKYLRGIVPAVHPVLIAWAGVVGIYSFFVRRDFKKVQGWSILALFACSATATAVLNFNVSVIGNLKVLVMVVLPIICFLPAFASSDANKRKKDIFKIFSGASIILFLSSAVSLVMYLIRFTKTVSIFGVNTIIGIEPYGEAVILTGIFEDTNHAATYAICSIFFSIFLCLECKKGLFDKKWINTSAFIFGLINIAVQLSYFPLANSRGGWLSLIIGLSISAFLYFGWGYKNPQKTSVLRIAAVAGVTLAVTLSAILSIRGVRSLWSEVSYQISTLTLQNADQTIYESAEVLSETHNLSNNVSFLQLDDNSVLSDSNSKAVNTVRLSKENDSKKDKFTKPGGTGGAGRIEIWENAFKLFTYNPVFGVNPGNIQYYAAEHLPQTNLAHGKEIHNSYIDLLLDYGAVGFALYLAFFVYCAVKILKLVFSYKLHGIQPYLLMAVILTIACSSFFLSCIFINTTATAFILMLTVGYLLSEVSDIENKRNDNDEKTEI